MAISYELARVGHARKISVFSRELIETGLPWRWKSDRVVQQIRAADVNVLVACDARRLVGFGIMRYGEEWAHLNLLAVHPRYQHQGIGTAILQWLENSALVGGILAINLEVRASNETALTFYRRAGYEEVALLRGYYQGKDSAVRMTRILRIPERLNVPLPWLAHQ